MRCVRAWAQHAGYRLQVHGLDLSAPLARVAREANPQWAERIHVGDVRTWKLPQPYDFVRIELVYASPSERLAMIRRCLHELTTDSGRVIVCSYRSRQQRHAPLVDPALRAWGFHVFGRSEALDDDRSVITRVVWLDRA